MVSFRLSDEEYERLQGACLAEGARSISDFARLAVQRSVWARNNRGDQQEDWMSNPGTKELIDVMRELNRHLGQLLALAQSANGPK